jgi:hypothetical protein
METVMTDDKKVKKVGMKDIQREGWEYELTLSLSLDRDTHMALPSKDRTELFEGKQPFIVTPETGKLIKDWCEKGVEENNIPATNGSTTKPDSYFKPPAKEAADFINIWEKEINGQTTKSALLHLYNNHKATVDADARLRQLFKSKQETFNV